MRAPARHPALVSALLATLLLSAGPAFAQGAAQGIAQAASQMPALEQLLPEGGGSTAGRVIQMVALLTVLSVAPGLLIMVTSFTRFVIAFSFLRSGLGLPSTPANLVLVSLSLFMTFYVMGPTFDRAWQDGVKPLTENRMGEEEALQRIADPFRDFMLTHVRGKDLKLFADIASRDKPAEEAANAPAAPEKAGEEKVPMRVLIPAFMISELRRGFEIGFLIVLPFLIIDMIVATLVMSMGMMMMPPAVISLPFKILFFILIDGWNLLVGGLIRSFF
ncbi:flagellar biosynthetic protein FliP [Xanthobacter flavus]|uniref:Flagellar biosynthetic protein FliP n=2 Tax=Xanthobacteraceae TaxID=335928 RepID=A0A9W6CGV7_XANFL|nr:flagellar biosynthetic protein FliP [Xanthobacter flavus]GLI20434.1 flagellar biosynthetic protein FliP [Xanthobacter flavus]